MPKYYPVYRVDSWSKDDYRPSTYANIAGQQVETSGSCGAWHDGLNAVVSTHIRLVGFTEDISNYAWGCRAEPGRLYVRATGAIAAESVDIPAKFWINDPNAPGGTGGTGDDDKPYGPTVDYIIDYIKDYGSPEMQLQMDALVRVKAVGEALQQIFADATAVLSDGIGNFENVSAQEYLRNVNKLVQIVRDHAGKGDGNRHWVTRRNTVYSFQYTLDY